ncbi:MAG: hypothetical protein GX257_02755 [Clostridiales bacterium]|jgi:stage III sporulation protein AB|nr:hypothetical protein [Clostridiales bacterium]
MIKTFGAICIILGSSMIGILANKRLKNHVALLQDLIGVCQTLESEISSKLSPIRSALLNAASSLGNEESICTVFITHVLSEMNEKGPQHFSEIWLSSVDNKLDILSSREKNLVKELAMVLGGYGVEEQISAIKTVRDGLNRFMHAAEQEKMRSGRVYMTLGMALGLGVVIILI